MAFQTGGTDRLATEKPFNNLLRTLRDQDYALIAPHLVEAEQAANELLYNPGDNVDMVYFPCGSTPGVVSRQQRGRTRRRDHPGRARGRGRRHRQSRPVAGLLPHRRQVWRAVRASPGERARGGEGAVLDVTATCSLATPTACWRRCFSPRPATRSIRSSSARPNGSPPRWSAPAITWCRSPRSSSPRCWAWDAATPAA